MDPTTTLRDKARLRGLIGEYIALRDLLGHTRQSRGQRFNGLIAEVLQCWGIDARANVLATGEIDVIFAVDAVHYVMEAKWLTKKTDTGAIAKLQKRVRQRLAGTYGVFLSMSGYSANAVGEVKDGERLEVMFLDRTHWEAMLTGQVPPARLFDLVRSHAAFRGEPYAELPKLLGSTVPQLNFALRMPADEPSREVRAITAWLFDGLGLGEHDRAEHRLYARFLPLSRQSQEAVVDEIARIAMTTSSDSSDERGFVACSLLEAADRLDPTLVKFDVVETMATAADFSLRCSAAVLLWQWAETNPGRVPVALLGRLARPTAEDWYVHAAARAGAKQLMLRRESARIIYEALAASENPVDRLCAASDLLAVAKREPRVIPAELAKSLAKDADEDVASTAAQVSNGRRVAAVAAEPPRCWSAKVARSLPGSGFTAALPLIRGRRGGSLSVPGRLP
jgi:Holliday junction resolvase-like predicted endonuclease